MRGRNRGMEEKGRGRGKGERKEIATGGIKPAHSHGAMKRLVEGKE